MTDTAKRQILLIEHDACLRELLSMALTLEGFVVRSAGNGREARETLLQQPPDIVLSCMMMPSFHVFEFLHWLRQEQQSSVPVVVLTRRMTAGMEDRLKQAGADDVLFKPVPVSGLVEHLKQL